MSHRSTSMACSGFDQMDLSRRSLIRAGGAGLLGLSVPTMLEAAEKQGKKIKARAKSVIFLFQWGGPSHIDMFDMKPDAPAAYRGPYKPIRSSARGLHICERLPRLAKVMDKVTVIRSVTHKMNNHNSAGYYALTGHEPPSDDQRLRDSLSLWPGYGSIVDYVLPGKGDMPNYVSYPHVIADGSRTPGQHASFLGKAHDPLFVPRDPNAADFKLPELSLPSGLTVDRLQARRGLQKLVDEQAKLMEYSGEARGIDDYYKRTLAMLSSKKVHAAFNLSKEPKAVRDRYGRSTYGQGCLLARRLVQSGVKFVTCYFARSIGGRSKTSGGWDTHGFDNTRMFPIVDAYHFPMTEQTLPTLLVDLDERGMLDETLVVWMGEFGRTPKINKNKSRDHWPQCYSVLLAGGGVKRGYVYGASDRIGAYPAANAVRPDDLAATIYYLLGIHPSTEVMDTVKRPLTITDGHVISDVIA